MIEKGNLLKWTATEAQPTDDKSGYYAVLVFLVWPLLALASAFWNYNQKWGKNILWAFVAFYGFTFAIGAESQGSDIVRYVAEVESLHGISLSVSDMVNYYLQSGEIDILHTVLAVTVSRFTDSQAILTLIYGIIFGFFFSRNVWYVIDHLKGKIQPITLLLLVCFALAVPIWNITTFRMWTAAHIFIYGALPFLFEGQKKGMIIAALSILVHYTFLIPVGALFMYSLLGNRLLVYFVFFLTTFFISEINLTVFNNVVENYAPAAVQERTEGYRGENYVESYRQGEGSSMVWYAQWDGIAFKWSIMGFLVILFLKGKDFFNKNEKWASLLSFTLFFYGIANLLSSLPSGGRFIAVANLGAVALITLYVQNREHEVVMKRFILAATPALLLFVVVAFRTGLYSISASCLMGNPVIALFVAGENISLNDVLKMVL
ncbi:EpsG family protein [Fodinibius salsisoli]|uniref:EpsG family protein n=1 Tax=Fodinibius salsisoli TaxID=2820877 RepID=A0ABT3PLC7_9BACT|nr:EpsG family protein [Fodinibius salsisoli]MCW9706761.1 EpsG family protein [Fodinibius salsisoli]